MREITMRECIKETINRWFSTYGRYQQNAPMPWTKGKVLGYYAERLKALDPETCSVDDVSEAMEKLNYVANDCDECGKSFDAVMRFGDEPDYDARWQDLCLGCLREAADKLKD